MAGIEPEATLAGTLRAWLLAPVITTLSRLEQKMTDVSQVLNDVAAGLSGPLATSIRELIAENATLTGENASLKGEDASESLAASNVRRRLTTWRLCSRRPICRMCRICRRVTRSRRRRTRRRRLWTRTRR